MAAAASITGTATATSGTACTCLEDVLRKASLTGGHLQLRRPGDAIDGPLEREEHRLIGRVHRHEHGHAQDDAKHGEERPHRVLAEIRPADECQQSHLKFTDLPSLLWLGRRMNSEESPMRSGVRHFVWSTAGVFAIVGASVAVSYAQQIWFGGYGSTPPKFPTKDTFTGSFTFCRALFSSGYQRQKSGWSTDYPGADINFSIRLSELTKADVKMLHGTSEGDMPDPVVVRLTDDALFECPFILMEDAGTALFSDEEVARLREYLLKGGFLFVSDYHGEWAKQQFDEEIQRALPEFPIIDLTPPDHAIWHTLYPVKEIAQMASIQTWRRTGGSTIERWNTEGAPPMHAGFRIRMATSWW